MVESKSCNISVSKSALELKPNKQTCNTSIQPLRSHDLKANHFGRGAIQRSSRPAMVTQPPSTATIKPDVDITNNLPTYNRLAVAEQPFLVAPETSSERNITSGDASALALLTFRDAGKRWHESRCSVLRARTSYMYDHHLNTLNKFFGEMRLKSIHVGHLIEYQAARKENKDGKWSRPAGPSIINHELSALQQVMKRAKLWAPIAEVYDPLRLPEFTKPKVLDDMEERHLFAVAASRPEWELALFAAKLARNTSAVGTELRHLRFLDVILDDGTPRITINAATAKNGFRGRTIFLNATAVATIVRCMERGKKLGAYLPEHFIFPKRIVRGLWDPFQPASSSWLRGPFGEMRKAAGFPWLTPHCFRHMAITVMLENGASPETVRHIAGHVSEQMMRHYSHNRLEAQKSVLEAMDSTPRPSTKRSAAARAQQRKFLRKGGRRLVQRRAVGLSSYGAAERMTTDAN